MSFKKTALLGSWLVAALFGSGCGHEDPVGVYAVVKKVFYEPDSANALKVRICGAFAVADTQSDSYQPALTGYMYYRCARDGDGAICRTRWQEMAATAGRCIAYGQRFDANTHAAVNNGEVRRDADTTNPDPYLTDWQVVVRPIEGEAAARCEEVYNLERFIDSRPCEMEVPSPPSPPPSGGGGGGGGSSSSGGLFGCAMGGAPGSLGSALGMSLIAISTLLAHRRRRRRASSAQTPEAEAVMSNAPNLLP